MEIRLMNIGHPRTGTGYMTKVYEFLDLKIGHEVLKYDGISDWAFCLDQCSSWTSPKYTFESFSPKHIVYNVRDPWDSVASIWAIHKDSKYLSKISQHLDVKKYQGLDQVAFSICEYDKHVSENRRIDGVVRIEHAQEDLQEISFLETYYRGVLVSKKKTDFPKEVYNARPHSRLTLKDWQSISPELIQRLDEFCEKYKYPLISDRIQQLENSQNRFCFCAVVRDESPVIERCLESIKNIAHSYLICDTGSKDDTIEKITTFMEKAGIPGEVFEKKWKSYGFNKSYLLWKLQNTEPYKSAEYIMWLDADEVFVTDVQNPTSYPTQVDAEKMYQTLNQLSQDIFMFKTRHGSSEYNRWQIARNNQKYLWKLPYQEYFHGEKSNTQIFLEDWVNYSAFDGNSSRDPQIFPKRITMTEKWLEKNQDTVEGDFVWPGPEDNDRPRIYYYLAEAYKSVDVERAIYYYEERLKLGGWVEEKYLTHLDLAHLKKDNVSKVSHLSAAIELIPDRLEAYYHLMMFYFNRKDYKKAYHIGMMAPESRVPGRHHFSNNLSVYNYYFDVNFAAACYQAGDYQKAIQLGEDLLKRKTYPPGKEITIQRDLQFSYDKLKISPTSEMGKMLKTVPTAVIVDGFYQDPDTVRRFALTQPFETKGNYPGTRTQPYRPLGVKEKFEQILGTKIKYWPDQYNGSFQIVTQERVSWIHRDKTDFSAIVFLTPDPPAQGGTIIYRHLKTGLQKAPTQEEDALLNLDSYNEKAWEIVDRIGNKYNRVVLFQGRNSHKSDLYFGTDKFTGRLFQTFFFDVEK